MDTRRFREALRRGCVDPWAAAVHWGKGGSPPPAPDYRGAAVAQGEANVETARTNARLSNPNIYTPLGRREVTFGQGGTFDEPAYNEAYRQYQNDLAAWQQAQAQPRQTATFGAGGFFGNPSLNRGTAVSATPRPVAPSREDFYVGRDPDRTRMDIELSPEQQTLYEGQTDLSQGLLDLGAGSLEQTAESLGTPRNQQSIQDIMDQAYAIQTSRLDPQWANAGQSYETQLVNQGLRPGDEAWDNAMRNFNQAKNDAYQQARMAAFQTAPTSYQLEAASRMQPLIELNAIRTGSQPQMPQFQPFTGSTAAPPPLFQAAQQQGAWDQGVYNAQMANQNSFMSGLMGLGGSLGGAWILSSDRRLKRNIRRIGTHWRGIGLYAYEIFGRREIGVMAQELLDVAPELVFRHPAGYLMVDYGRL